MSIPLTRSHEEATMERFRRDQELASHFLEAILKDGDAEEIMYVQQLLTKAFGADGFDQTMALSK